MKPSSVADCSRGDLLTTGQEERLAAILDDYLVSLERGQAPTTEEVLARHPDLAGSLRSYLEDVHRLQHAADNFARGCVPIDGPDAAGPPRRLGDFELIREIGRGGMGVVFEAWQVPLRRRVALKVLPMGAMLDSKRLARFQNEAYASAQLDHPHIVSVHAIGAEHGVHYYAMQYIDGQPLNEVIRQLRRCPPRSEREPQPGTPWLQAEYARSRAAYYRCVARLGVQAARALHAAHEVGIVHRDIKPSNLLLDAEGKLWITDFGLARCRANADLTRTGDLLGTMRYMSPEQAAGRSLDVDHRSDIYSLGITLYELLTLCPAVRGNDGPELLRKIEQQEPLRPRALSRDLPADLEIVIQKSSAKSRQERYPTAADMADDLQRFLDGLPTVARPYTLVERTRRWVRRHQRLVRITAGLAAVSLLALLACTLIVWRQGARTQRALAAAEANLRLAQANYQRARETVDRFGAQLAEELAEVPGAQTVRLRLLRDTLRYYQGLVGQSSRDPVLQEDLAVTYTKIGGIAEQIGDVDEALEAYRTATQAFAQLVDQNPSLSLPRSRLALCQNNLALLLMRRGQADEAHELFQQAIRAQTRLISESTDRWPYAAELALTKNNLGLLLVELGRPQAAGAAYHEAAELQRQLAAEHPDDAKVARDLAGTLNNLTLLDADTRSSAALDASREALAIHRRLARENPDDLSVQRDLALACNNVAAIHARLGQLDQASHCFQESIATLERLTARAPDVGRYQQDLAVSCNNLGLLQCRSGLTAEAAAEFHRALQVQETLVAAHPRNPDYLSGLAGIHNNLGLLLLQEDTVEEAIRAFRAAEARQTAALELAPQVERFRTMLNTHRANLEKAAQRTVPNEHPPDTVPAPGVGSSADAT